MVLDIPGGAGGSSINSRNMFFLFKDRLKRYFELLVVFSLTSLPEVCC